MESVANQTFGDWLHVVVLDAGVTPDVEALVAGYVQRDPGRYCVLRNEKPCTIEASSNRALRETASRYVAFHDDDDAWHPDFLKKTVNFLETEKRIPKLAGVITHAVRVVEKIENDRIVTIHREDFNTWIDCIRLFRMLAFNMFPPISFVYRRDVLDTIGPYREDLPPLADWEFNIRFLLHYEIGVIRERLAFYHHRETDAAPEYSNSVVSDVDHHVLWTAVLQNEWLRQDIAAGRVGMGALSYLSQHFELLHRPIEKMFKRARRSRPGFLQRLFGRKAR
jgi:glycosyltransferase involved in cell wall biosynthesis